MSEAAILVVDSDIAFRTSLVQHLSDNGCNVSHFTEMQPVLSRFLNGEFDIAIIEFCNILKDQDPYITLKNRPSGTALILTSITPTIESELAARILSPAYFFVKPVGINDIFAVVVRIIEQNNYRLLHRLRNNRQHKGEYHG